VRGWMDHEGWTRKKRMIQGARAWGYERPTDWPPQEPLEPPEAAPGPSVPTNHGNADDEPF
jgi:putative DNA primase/helicase